MMPFVVIEIGRNRCRVRVLRASGQSKLDVTMLCVFGCPEGRTARSPREPPSRSRGVDARLAGGKARLEELEIRKLSN